MNDDMLLENASFDIILDEDADLIEEVSLDLDGDLIDAVLKDTF